MSNNLEKISNTAQDEKPQDLFYALINQEEQYSLWPDYKAIPEGWEIRCGPAPKDECLVYVEKKWTDMRPLSLRRQMAALEQKTKLEDSGTVVTK
jgi:MbtH protein